MANLITLSRLVLLFALSGLALKAPPAWQLANAPLILLIIALDGVDGWIARLLGEQTRFGSVFDIMADRIVENVMWIVLAQLGLAPVWVPIVVITRSIVVDSIRYPAVAANRAVFDVMTSRWGRRLVSGRFMRAMWGTTKAITFGWLLALQPLPEVAPAFWATWSPLLLVIGDGLIIFAVAVCLLRGIPVVIEWLLAESAAIKPKPGPNVTQVGG